MLGGFIDGVPVDDERFAGGALGFLSGFAVVCGLGLVAGYALLGATWLILKTAGTTGEFGRRAARPALLVTLAFVAVVSLWTPLVASADRAALVQPAQYPLPLAGAVRHRARRLGDLAQHPQQL